MLKENGSWMAGTGFNTGFWFRTCDFCAATIFWKTSGLSRSTSWWRRLPNILSFPLHLDRSSDNSGWKTSKRGAFCMSCIHSWSECLWSGSNQKASGVLIASEVSNSGNCKLLFIEEQCLRLWRYIALQISEGRAHCQLRDRAGSFCSVRICGFGTKSAPRTLDFWPRVHPRVARCCRASSRKMPFLAWVSWPHLVRHSVSVRSEKLARCVQEPMGYSKACQKFVFIKLASIPGPSRSFPKGYDKTRPVSNMS